MKKTITILMGMLMLTVCCKEATKKTEDKAVTPNSTSAKTETPDLTTLCKINGEPWSYNEGSGILIEDRNKGIRVLTMTFTKFVNPGKEHVGLSYNEATKELIEASVQIKKPGKDGKPIHAIYLYNDRTPISNPKSRISGQVTLGDDMASGTAQLQNLQIQYEGSLLANEKDAKISVTDLSFNNIPFSDVKKEMEAIFKNSK